MDHYPAQLGYIGAEITFQADGEIVGVDDRGAGIERAVQRNRQLSAGLLHYHVVGMKTDIVFVLEADEIFVDL